MKTFRILPFILLALGVAGCATTPKQELTEAQYDSTSRIWVGMDKCLQQGEIDTTLVAQGRNIVQSNLNQVVFDSQKLNTQINTLRQDTASVSKKDCTELAIAIQQRKQQIEDSRRTVAVAPAQPTYTPPVIGQTHCNRVGTQTLCTTF